MWKVCEHIIAGKDDPIDREHPGLVLNAKSLMIEWDEDVMDKVQHIFWCFRWL